MRGTAFQFQIGERVKNPLTRKQGVIRNRRQVLVQKKQSLARVVQYEIACEDGRCWIEFQDNLEALRMLTRARE